MSPRRIASLTCVIFLSIAIPIGITCWSVISAVSGKPPDGISFEIKIYQGILKNRELWFGVYTYTGTAVAPASERCRIKCLDLETGDERETGLVINGDFVHLFKLKDELFGIGRSMLYRITDTTVEKLVSLPARYSSFHTIPFLFGDRITTIADSTDDGFRLVHLDNDRWIKGRKILLPGHDRVWYDDPERGRKRLLPLSSIQPVPTAAGARPLVVWVIQRDHQFHVLCTDFRGFTAYRTGFEFVDEDDGGGGVSAMAPENASHEVSGWEPIQPAGENDRWNWMVDDQLGLLFASHSSSCRVVRRTTDGRWQTITGAHVQPHCVILADPAESTSYIVSEDQKWGSAVVHRIDGNTIQPAHLVLHGSMPEYLARWRRLLSGLVVAWLTHVAVLIAGSIWLSKRATEAVYEFGNQQARLASIGRRILAFCIDFSLASTILVLLVYDHLAQAVAEWKLWKWTEKELCNKLFECEQAIYGTLKNGPYVPVHGHFEFVLTAMVIFLALYCIKSLVEGRCGVTLGKALLGIRTVSSTLRPCGFVRALLRDVLYCIDIPLLLTPLPASISIILSEYRKRVGDSVADTLVVDARSIRESEFLSERSR